MNSNPTLVSFIFYNEIICKNYIFFCYCLLKLGQLYLVTLGTGLFPFFFFFLLLLLLVLFVQLACHTLIMASDNNSDSVTMLREILHKITNLIATKCDQSIPVSIKNGPAMVRRSTRAIYGDICIPGGVVKLHLPTEQHVEEVIEAIMAASETFDFPILTCSPAENDFISIKLQRTPAFSQVISHVMKEGSGYGHQHTRREKIVLLNVPETMKKEKEAEGVGLSSLRQLLLAQHVSALLEANGYRIHQGHSMNTGMSSSALIKILGDIIPEESTSISYRTTEKDLPPGFLDELSSSKYVSSKACQTDEEKDHQQSLDGRSSYPCDSQSLQDGLPRECRLDLGAVLEHQRLRTGKGGYSKNLTEVQLTDTRREASPVLKQCMNLRHAAEEMKSSAGLCVLHVVPSSHEFIQQQVDLTMRALSRDDRYSDQSHLCCAPVQLAGAVQNSGDKKQKEMDVGEFCAIRYSQMREASVMKYGDQVKGDSWNNMIHSLTAAGITFDILGTHFRHPVKLDVGKRYDSNPWPDNRNGVFVVYNYARLSTLFTRFQEEVQKGTYPALPPTENIDFSTLKEEAEWKLLFSHILTLPDVILDSVGEGFTTPQELSCKFETHKICRYLISLSQDLSTYYSRFRILVEPRPHLLPTMYARIYLLKAVHQVLNNGLALLKIKPLTQM